MFQRHGNCVQDMFKLVRQQRLYVSNTDSMRGTRFHFRVQCTRLTNCVALNLIEARLGQALRARLQIRLHTTGAGFIWIITHMIAVHIRQRRRQRGCAAARMLLRRHPVRVLYIASNLIERA